MQRPAGVGAHRPHRVQQPLTPDDYNRQPFGLDASHLSFWKVVARAHPDEFHRTVEERVVVDRGPDAEGQLPADVRRDNNDQPRHRGQEDRGRPHPGSQPHDKRHGLDRDYAGHRQTMDNSRPPFVARGLVEVRVAGQGGENRAGEADGEREVTRDLRHPAGGDEDPVRQHADGPGSDRYVRQRGVEGVTEDLGAVHHVLDRYTGHSERRVERADRLLNRLSHRVQPRLAADHAVQRSLARARLPDQPADSSAVDFHALA